MAHHTMQFFDTSQRTKDARIANAALDAEVTADWWDEYLPAGPQKDAALQHLLEAKDAACRASLDRPAEEAASPVRVRRR